jgi:hypothetical protein
MRAMTINGLCLFLCITHDAWSEYRKRPEFTGVCASIEQAIREQKFTGAAAGLFNHAIIARDLGLVTKLQTEHTGLIDLAAAIRGTAIRPKADD